MNPKLKIFIGNHFYILVLLLAFGLRVWQLDAQSLWWDEVKTVFRMTLSIEEMLADLLQKRGHVPLYFLLMQWWGRIGLTDFITRYFSVIWGTVGVALIYKLALLMGKRPFAQTAAFLLAISPFHIWYSQEARMYSFLPSLITLSTILLIMGLKRQSIGYWIDYGLMMATAVYTHYFAILILFTHTIFFALSFRMIQQKAIRWLVSAAAVGGLFTLYGVYILQNGGYQNSTPGWIQPIHWYEPFLTMLTFSAGRTIISTELLPRLLWLIFFAGFVASFLYQPSKNGAKQQTTHILSLRLIRLWFIVPLLIVYLVSLGISSSFSVYNDRYLIIILPAFILLVALGLTTIIEKINTPYLPTAVFLTIALLTIPSLRNLYNDERFARIDMRQTAVFLLEQHEVGDVLVGQGDVKLPFTHYAGEQAQTIPFIELPVNYSDPSDAALFDQIMRAQIEKANENQGRVWYISQAFNFSPHGYANARVNRPDLRAQWLNDNLHHIDHWHFPGISLMLFEQ